MNKIFSFFLFALFTVTAAVVPAFADGQEESLSIKRLPVPDYNSLREQGIRVWKFQYNLPAKQNHIEYWVDFLYKDNELINTKIYDVW